MLAVIDDLAVPGNGCALKRCVLAFLEAIRYLHVFAIALMRRSSSFR